MLKRKRKEDNKRKKLKKDNNQTELTKFFIKDKDVLPTATIVDPKVTTIPQITQKSSLWKQATPKTKRMSLKRPHSNKRTPKATPSKTTPNKATPSKQRRIDEYKNFTPTKLAYLLQTDDTTCTTCTQSNNQSLLNKTFIQLPVGSSLIQEDSNADIQSLIHNTTQTANNTDVNTIPVDISSTTSNRRHTMKNEIIHSNTSHEHVSLDKGNHLLPVEKEQDTADTEMDTNLSVYDRQDIIDSTYDKENDGRCKAKRTLLFNGCPSDNCGINGDEEDNMMMDEILVEKKPVVVIATTGDNRDQEGTLQRDKTNEVENMEYREITKAVQGNKGQDSINDISFSDSDDELDELLCNFSIMSHDSHMTLPLRYRVLHVEFQNYCDENNLRGRGQQLVVQLMSLEQGRSKATCYLRDDWIQTDIRCNDIVHIVSHYSSRTDYHHNEPITLCQDEYIISNYSGSCIIINPDYLISGTTIANGITCTRRAVLEELFKGHSEQNDIMLLGKSLHDIFQQTITAASKGTEITQEYVYTLIPPLVYHISTIQQLYSLDMTELQLEEQLMEYVPVIVQWCNEYQTDLAAAAANNNYSTILPQKRIEWKRTQTSVSEMMNVSVSEVLDIEENVWSPRYGLKGKVDATVQVKVTDNREYSHEFLAPLELKTGKKSSVIQHRAQVLLYCLMLCDSHMTSVPSGLLYYMKVNETLSVPVKDNEIRALLMARNHLARYHGNHWDHVTLPEMIKEPRTCHYCPLLSHCALYHKSFEEGTVATSGLHEHYPLKIDNMTTAWVEFYKHWHRLVVEELTFEQTQSMNGLIWRTDIRDRVNEGCCIGDLLSCQSEPLSQSLLRIKQKFIKQEHNNNYHIFNCYDRIIVSQVGGASGRSWAVAIGYILTINDHSCTLALDKAVPVGNLYCIDVTPPRVGGVILSTLAAVCSSDGEREQQLRELVIDLKVPQFSIVSTANGFSASEQSLVNSLNEDQKKAIEKVLLAKDYSLILGMPGTGKTTTIACLIELLIGRGHSVLLTSFTNSAVDNVLVKLLEKGVDFIRLGSIGRIHSSVSVYSVHQLTNNITNLNQLRTLYQGKLLVATTCHSVDHPLFKDRTFDYCIMDEAGQIPLPLSLAPLKLVSRFVLVGDHYQLPPLVRSPVAKKGGYEESLFKRLSSAHPFTLTSLTLQHRMNRDIMQLSNQLIYNNLLQCASDEVAMAKLCVSQELPIDTPTWLNMTIDSSASVVFLNTDKCGKELEDRSGEQISNLFEANHIIKIIGSLIKVGIDPSDILVITQYKHQQRLIARLLFELKARDIGLQTDSHTTFEQTHSHATFEHTHSHTIAGYESIEVLTVDKCQGRDKSCVLMSFVRSNNNGKVGTLLLNWQRINVALTRAKHKLVFIGSCDTLSNAPYLLKLIKLIENHHRLIDL